MKRITLFNYVPEITSKEKIQILDVDGSTVVRTFSFTGVDDYHAAIRAATEGQTLFFSKGEFVIDKNTPTEFITSSGYIGYQKPMLSINKYVHFKGVPGKTILKVRSDLVNTGTGNYPMNSLFSFFCPSSDSSKIGKIQDIIFEYHMLEKPRNFANAIFSWENRYISLENCVIRTIGTNKKVSLCYNNNGDIFVTSKNCTFFFNVTELETSYSGYDGSRVQFLDCAFNCSNNSAFYSDVDPSTKFNLAIDPDQAYKVTTPGENTQVGVYSGDRAWPSE